MHFLTFLLNSFSLCFFSFRGVSPLLNECSVLKETAQRTAHHIDRICACNYVWDQNGASGYPSVEDVCDYVSPPIESRDPEPRMSTHVELGQVVRTCTPTHAHAHAHSHTNKLAHERTSSETQSIL